MPKPLYDVFLLRSEDTSPTGVTRLADNLAARQGAPTTLVRRAVMEKTLKVGRSLEQPQAHALVRELKALGALTVIRPAGAARATTGTFAAYTGNSVASQAGPPPITAGPPSIDLADDAEAPPLTLSAIAAEARMTSDRGTTTLPRAVEDDSRYAPPQEADASLELAVPTPTMAELSRPSRSVAGASAMNIPHLVASASDSGLVVDSKAANVYIVRCPTHGLTYDTRRASGCRRCLAEPARHVSRALAGSAARAPLASFDSPAKRAFVGLGLALFVGLIPASYYALRKGGGEMSRLREEQTVLSQKASTEEALSRFDRIDVDIDQAYHRSLRNTALLWLVVTGGTLAAWYRVT